MMALYWKQTKNPTSNLESQGFLNSVAQLLLVGRFTSLYVKQLCLFTEDIVFLYFL